MIQAAFKRNTVGDIISFEVTGHAESGPEGRDIVCAAVSALTIGTANSLSVLTGKTPFVKELDEIDGGYLYVEVSKDFDEEQLKISQVLLESLLISLTSVAEEYADHVSVKNK